jgi:ATP synthase protein I
VKKLAFFDARLIEVTTMGDDKLKPSSGQVKDFDKRLQRAQKAIKGEDQKQYRSGSAYSLGFRITTDLVVAVLAGLGIGWALDYWLGTKPWFLLIFIPLGIAAGILNVLRVAKSDEARRHMEYTSQGPAAPASDDDDDN